MTVNSCTVTANSATGEPGGGSSTMAVHWRSPVAQSPGTRPPTAAGCDNYSAEHAYRLHGHRQLGRNGGRFYHIQRHGTLTDTIVAGNTSPDGGDQRRHQRGGAVGVTGSYNLIGTGGSGGISDGTGHNIVLASLASLGLTTSLGITAGRPRPWPCCPAASPSERARQSTGSQQTSAAHPCRLLTATSTSAPSRMRDTPWPSTREALRA